MSDTPRTDRAAYESIVSVYETSKQLERELAETIAQRDELLEALQSCFEVFVNQGWDDDLIAAKNAKAAIAKLKGKSHE